MKDQDKATEILTKMKEFYDKLNEKLKNHIQLMKGKR